MRFVFGLCALLVACGSSTPVTPDVDGGLATLEVGTGQESFTPVTDGEVLPLHRGCQGAQHVWIGLRADGFSSTQIVIEMSLVRLRDGMTVSLPYTSRTTLVREPGSSAMSAAGYTLVVDNPDNVLLEDLEIRAYARDPDRHEARAAKRVRIEWGEPYCPTGGGAL